MSAWQGPKWRPPDPAKVGGPTVRVGPNIWNMPKAGRDKTTPLTAERIVKRSAREMTGVTYAAFLWARKVVCTRSKIRLSEMSGKRHY